MKINPVGGQFKFGAIASVIRLLMGLIMGWHACLRAESPVVTHGPMLGRITDSSVDIWVRTSRSAEIQIRYGTDPDRLSRMAPAVTTRAEHDNTGTVRLTGLAADTLYFYSVTGPLTLRPWTEMAGSFRTLPNADTYRDPTHNPKGYFNFSFAFGACNAQMQGTAAELPAFRHLIDQHRRDVAFFIQNGDWIYEDKRDYPLSAWLEQNGVDGDNVPEILRLAPPLAGVWENYKVYLERGANLREWTRQVPSFFTVDDHELLGDVTGSGAIGLRDRRAVFRDIGIRGWRDHVGWATPRSVESDSLFGRARMTAGSDVMEVDSDLFANLDTETLSTLLVFWNEPTAGINDEKLDRMGGDPNAGVYEISAVVDSRHLRLRPAARATGEVRFSVGRPQYSSFRVSNTEFFFLDTRSHRQLGDPKKPFDPTVSMLGTRQKRWLKESLARSDAEIFFVVSSVPVMLPHIQEEAKIPELSGGSDSWTAYGAERHEMIEFWKSLGKPVLLLTGDIHNSYALKVSDQVWEFLSAPLNSGRAFTKDAGNPPPNGTFRWQDESMFVRWSTTVPADAPRPRYDPVYAIAQVNNIFSSVGPNGEVRWLTYPHPQVIVQFYSGLTGKLIYAESVLTARQPGN